MAIKIKKSHQGWLHKRLGVPATEGIPLSALASAKESGDPALRKMATFAINARRWKKK